jgi:hypothetical protein
MTQRIDEGLPTCVHTITYCTAVLCATMLMGPRINVYLVTTLRGLFLTCRGENILIAQAFLQHILAHVWY